MMRHKRMVHLKRVAEATDKGVWCDLGRATHGLRRWFARHGLVVPRPVGNMVSWRDVQITPKGRESLAVAQREYALR